MANASATILAVSFREHTANSASANIWAFVRSWKIRPVVGGAVVPHIKSGRLRFVINVMLRYMMPKIVVGTASKLKAYTNTTVQNAIPFVCRTHPRRRAGALKFAPEEVPATRAMATGPALPLVNVTAMRITLRLATANNVNFNAPMWALHVRKTKAVANPLEVSCNAYANQGGMGATVISHASSQMETNYPARATERVATMSKKN